MQGRPATEAQRAAFLDHLRVSANVAAAAERAGASRRTVYRWREADDAFAVAWADAVEEAVDALEGECMRRAKDGVERCVVNMGKIVRGPDGEPLVERVYSDGLMILLLKAYRPERFRDRASVEVSMTGSLAAAIEEGRKRARLEGSTPVRAGVELEAGR